MGKGFGACCATVSSSVEEFGGTQGAAIGCARSGPAGIFGLLHQDFDELPIRPLATTSHRDRRVKPTVLFR
jgi:hypothetical protein